MREYILERVMQLNPARGHNATSDRAIDDICRALEAGNDPNAIDEDEAPT